MSIQISELHIKERTIEIRNAKGHKERIISISEDMAFLLENYCRFIKSMVSVQDKWLFPAVNPAFHLSSGALGDRFNRFWNPWILSVRKIRFLRLYCHTMTSLLSKKLFFSMTYDFLTVYIPQDSASSKTVKTYRDGLTIFRRYVAEVKGFSI